MKKERPVYATIGDPNKKKIWECKIGEVEAKYLEPGSDSPMRRAIEKAYKELTGQEPEFIFSGWGGELTPGERRALKNENRYPCSCPSTRFTNGVCDQCGGSE